MHFNYYWRQHHATPVSHERLWARDDQEEIKIIAQQCYNDEPWPSI